MFPRIHGWGVVSQRGTWYRQKQQLAAGSLANKRNHVRTVVLPGMTSAVLIICKTFMHRKLLKISV